jgi:hypothetical protein
MSIANANMNAEAVPCLDCPGEDTQKMDAYFFNDLLSSYRTEYQKLSEEKLKLSTIGNRTLTKKREYQIANDLYLRDLAQIERLKITMLYLLACIGVLALVFISILPSALGYTLVSLVLIAYILHIIFINNNFFKRYNLNYALFQFKQYEKDEKDTEPGSVLKCEYVPT